MKVNLRVFILEKNFCLEREVAAIDRCGSSLPAGKFH